jgi:hypothetical protein
MHHYGKLPSLRKNKTWKYISLLPIKQTIGSWWIFKIKINFDGSIDKNKAHLVAKCYSQIEGIDHRGTFSLMVELNSIRAILALATQHSLKLHQFNVFYGSIEIFQRLENPTKSLFFGKLLKALWLETIHLGCGIKG